MMLHVSGTEELSLERIDGLSESRAHGQEGSVMGSFRCAVSSLRMNC